MGLAVLSVGVWALVSPSSYADLLNDIKVEAEEAGAGTEVETLALSKLTSAAVM